MPDQPQKQGAEWQLLQDIIFPCAQKRNDMTVGLGDDAACLQVPAGHELVACTDTMVQGTHFFPDAKPADLGHKIAAVNLSDIAAMGADASWLLCSLSLPQANLTWVKQFYAGMHEVLRAHNVVLVGGDLTQGPLSMTVQALGTVPAGQALTRAGAKPGDVIIVTGELGLAALGLQLAQAGGVVGDSLKKHALQRFHRPVPHLAQGRALRDLAHAAIDLSDGLVGDIGHVLTQSGVGATLEVGQLPLACGFAEQLGLSAALAMALCGGEDYVLLATLAQEKLNQWHLLCEQYAWTYAVIGQVEQESGLRLLSSAGQMLDVSQFQGFQHF